MKRHAGAFLALALSSAFGQSAEKRIEAPRFWNDRDLADWATPVAGLNVRPGHYSEREYYSAPVGDWVRTYPVYFPGREPPGYSDMLRNAKPEPLITPGARTMVDWVKDGKRVFHELDIAYLRSYDPKLAEILRSAADFQKLGCHPQKDGTVLGLRWVPTSKGLALSIQDCSGCHSRVMPEGSVLDGAPDSGSDPGDGVSGSFTTHSSAGFLEFYSPGETPGMVAWRFWAAPWVPNDVNESPTLGDPRDFGFVHGVVPRLNSSPFYPTKVPDLIGVKDRRYIDHTATHRLRGPEDLRSERLSLWAGPFAVGRKGSDFVEDVVMRCP